MDKETLLRLSKPVGILLAVVLLVILSAGTAWSQAPTEPPVEQAIEMETHPSLGVVFTYADGSRFAHPKKGAIEYLPSGKERLEVRHELGEVWYITADGAWYTLSLEPTFYFEDATGQYRSLIPKSWSTCVCDR
ncbi:hypothetical protein [Nitrospina gracilis]|uniref:hypothetical protein n=1 Tax=Nitrospina gracilis TaxID=35801 RepID=UPI001F233DEE|nr:hypothetical protein [Nitrospina gracilis]MCF8719485.1 hypothetical protein [Nitrospina gracilis Nb-211]